jgi:uncharacterized protein (UPF0332 family)
VRSRTENFIAKARRCLGAAITNYDFPLPDVAAKEAYLAGYHSAEALIYELSGKAAKTHRGVRIRFADLARADPRIDPAFTEFLAQAFDFKIVADYGTDPEDFVTMDQAARMIETARRFVDCIEKVLVEKGE